MINLPIILDNFIDSEIQNKIEDLIFECNWIFKMDNTRDYSRELMNMKYRKILNPFEHNISPSISSDLFQNFNLLNLYKSVIQKVCDEINFEVDTIIRCIAGIQGVQVLRKTNKVCHIHTNRSDPHLVLLYYVNDCDGDTILFKETTDKVPYKEYASGKYRNFEIDMKITPKRGRILIFDGNTYHSASSPTKGIRSIITTDLSGNFFNCKGKSFKTNKKLHNIYYA